MTDGLDEILRESCHLMARRGFHGTSMRDLAQETGRSLSGLYHYFRSKEDLLFLINFYGFTTLNDAWTRLIHAFESPYEKLYAFIYFHTGYFVEHMDEMRVMTWGTQALSLEKARVIQKLKDRYTGDARGIVQDVYRTGSGCDMPERRLQRETYLLFGMMNWMFSWYSPQDHGGVGDLAQDIYRTFVSGISGNGHGEIDTDRMNAAVGKSFHENKTESMWATVEEPDRQEN
ncbi:MAG: TetR/AcrR family transcriptional regulator [Candidatus Krumholzibacteriia bacterium]